MRMIDSEDRFTGHFCAQVQVQLDQDGQIHVDRVGCQVNIVLDIYTEYIQIRVDRVGCQVDIVLDIYTEYTYW